MIIEWSLFTDPPTRRPTRRPTALWLCITYPPISYKRPLSGSTRHNMHQYVNTYSSDDIIWWACVSAYVYTYTYTYMYIYIYIYINFIFIGTDKSIIYYNFVYFFVVVLYHRDKSFPLALWYYVTLNIHCYNIFFFKDYSNRWSIIVDITIHVPTYTDIDIAYIQIFG